MVIIWGERFSGRVDAVPGLFHVETKFGHIYYVPLIPEQSWLVLSKTGDGIRGVPLPFHWKSVAVAYARVALGLGAVIGLVALVGLSNSRHTTLDLVIAWAAMIAAVVLLVWSYFMHRVGRASYERAMELARAANFSEEGMLQVGRAFGKITEEEYRRLRADLREVRQAGAEVTLKS